MRRYESPIAKKAKLLASATRLIAVPVLFVLFPTTSIAGELLNTNGFESYDLGQLKNQLEGPTLWLSAGNGGGSAEVANSIGVDSTKAVRIERQADSYDWWSVPFTGSGLPNARFVMIDWDMKVLPTNANQGVYGPFFGVEVYDEGIYPNFPGLLATFGVDATTRDVVYQDAISFVETGYTVDDAWHHFQLQLDYQTNTYDISVNQLRLNESPIGFIDGPSTSFGDADIAAYEAATDLPSLEQPGTAYIDNFRIRESNLLPGDFNADGSVDLADYTVWRDHLGAADELAIANAGDGLLGVDTNDYLLWKSNFGTTLTAGSLHSVTVPEPSAICLLGLSIVGFWLVRR
ncbi:PEP-CTERM sorting domain-containing protein [Aeoliella mucimassa]|uniref:Ice-binding protein C-terminal domain-containing protein n=1 Tax=Aeoliella mucimassa TaxID=2527972 RepID=A0A518AJB2_9BACT|nr:PEP-CTERM sorting domain-containing protein [Aeoliella mucimassa]QDU54823.1 hypothetical protein Pan181_10060 [Aeoliella mucimassa]